ncbi:hypothetical protein Ocin01_02457 [Orchesella cincta]|uniref:Uncharacterized protein n=1 Tax=Orchesella cincta TaxID=48709 RepID=A0A1D2NG37_ORCCI|nr:hypothetical protein Ocin01_02457 [Orchesella cincta]
MENQGLQWVGYIKIKCSTLELKFHYQRMTDMVSLTVVVGEGEGSSDSDPTPRIFGGNSEEVQNERDLELGREHS